LFREMQKQDNLRLPDPKPRHGHGSNDPGNDEMKNELKRYLMELSGTPEPVPQQQSSMTKSNFIELGSAYQ